MVNGCSKPSELGIVCICIKWSLIITNCLVQVIEPEIIATCGMHVSDECRNT